MSYDATLAHWDELGDIDFQDRRDAVKVVEVDLLIAAKAAAQPHLVLTDLRRELGLRHVQIDEAFADLLAYSRAEAAYRGAGIRFHVG